MAKKITLQKFSERDITERERIAEIIAQKIDNAINDIEEAIGYKVEVVYSVLRDDVAKSMEVEINLALLARPHTIDDVKVKHYLKVNPHNVLDEPIIAFKHHHWYEILNGVHRTEARRRRGDKTIKAIIVVPLKEDLKERKLIE